MICRGCCRSVLAVVGLAGALAAPHHARAQSTSVQAQSLFDDGRKLLKAGKIAEACTAFESSQKLEPVVTTLLNLAECREQNHQLATAWGLFVEANRMAKTSNSPNREKLARVALSHAKKLEPRLSKLTISVPPGRPLAGLEVLRDKEPVNPASWNHALPIDGGTYTIAARAPGRALWSTTKTIKVEADAQVVEIPALVEDKPATPVATAPSSPPAGAKTIATRSPGDESGEPSGSSGLARRPGPIDPPEAAPSMIVPLAVGGGALVLGGAALGFHLWGNSTYDRAKKSMDPAERSSLYSSANTRRYVAEGLGVAAIGCAGVAVYLYIRSSNERHAGVAVAPVVTPQLAGLAAIARW